MPELPEMQALSERLDACLVGARFSKFDILSFSGLKTVRPAPADLVGQCVQSVTRRAKYVIFETSEKARLLIHLSQAGRLDIESPPKATKPRGSVVRITFDDDRALLVREFGTERKARWWILGPKDDGPLATLGPEATSEAFAQWIRTGRETRHLHTMLRDQHLVAGLGRGHTDDALNAAGLSPFSSLASLSELERERLIESIRTVLGSALERERTREGGLSEARLGERFLVHNRTGGPCPRCSARLERISYDSYEIVYCPECQTKGRVLADRRLSRLLR